MTSTTTSESDGCQILKQDELGRVRTPRPQREAILAQFEGSGMSGAAFAAHVGVKYSTFAGWVLRRRKQREKQGAPAETAAGGASAPCRWIEVVAGGPAPGPLAPVVVVLPGGARIELRDAGGVALAAELIGRLGGARGC